MLAIIHAFARGTVWLEAHKLSLCLLFEIALLFLDQDFVHLSVVNVGFFWIHIRDQ
jgi:hypothetical protein